ncbi:LuxR C-terminal-related transcriptional regulator [Microbacterium sp. 2P01SA-2]|uniref:LuxR C-terminal-related transcriptional regulator n=1 Tax=unclassified Microbacterium TaxID=2609290 RepID=UPI0039A101D2
MNRISAGGAGFDSATGVSDRPRLTRVLESPLVRLCVIQGPSGAGKTTLVRSWMLRAEQPRGVVRVSVPSGITSTRMLWHRVIVAAGRPGRLSAETVAGADALIDTARRLIPADHPVVLVLDAYERLGELTERVDHDLLRLLAAYPMLRVIVTTRGETALSVAALDDGITRVISRGELAFTAGEVGTLLREQAGITDERVARQVVAATGGLALTVRAAVQAISQVGHIPRLDSSEWNGVMADRIASSLGDPETVEFVTDTAVLPFVDAALASRLTGDPDAEALLTTLERDGFGRWIPYASGGRVFQYVETVKDAFRARAQRDGDRYRRMCVAAAQAMLDGGTALAHALELAVEGEDWALADRVLAHLAASSADSHPSDTLLPVLQRVPREVLPRHPMLAFGLALALSASPLRWPEAAGVFETVIDTPSYPTYFAPELDEPTMMSVRATALRLRGDWRASNDLSLDALELVSRIEPETASRFGEHLGAMLRQLSLSLWQGGRLSEAMTAATRSAAAGSKPASRNSSTALAAAMTAPAGDTVRARAMLATLDRTAWPVDAPRPVLAIGLAAIAETWISLDALDFRGATRHLKLAPTASQSECWPLATATSLAVWHGKGFAAAEAERVWAELERGDLPGMGENVASQQLHAALALAWLAAGDHRRAAEALESQPDDSPMLSHARVMWLLAERRDAAAFEQAELELALPGHTIRSRAELQTSGAIAALRVGDEERAWAWLGAAALVSDHYGARMHVALLHPRDRLALGDFAAQRNALVLQRYLKTPGRARAAARPVAVPLTDREKVVLTAVDRHGSTRDAAAALFVSPSTVKAQLQSIYRKLGVTSRRAACEVARELGILDPKVPLRLP